MDFLKLANLIMRWENMSKNWKKFMLTKHFFLLLVKRWWDSEERLKQKGQLQFLAPLCSGTRGVKRRLLFFPLRDEIV